MEDFEKEFYLNYGLMATKLSSVDFYAGEILAKLIDKDEDLLTTYLIKDTGFYRRLELLKELAYFRTEYKSELLNLSGLMSKIKNHRNVFFHCLWLPPVKHDHTFMGQFSSKNVNRTLEGKSTHWVRRTRDTLMPDEIKDLINRSNKAIEKSKELLEKLEKEERW